MSAKLKVNSVIDIDDAGEAEVIIKKGVQAVLENLKEYQALKYFLFWGIYHLLKKI